MYIRQDGRQTSRSRNRLRSGRVPVAMQPTLFERPLLSRGPVSLAGALVAIAAACAPPPVPAPEPLPEPEPTFAHDTVWTAAPRVLLRSDSTSFLIPRPFTRLDVVGGDTAVVQVRCPSCPGDQFGEVAVSDLVFEAPPPEIAAWGSLAEFALALRQAAARADVSALRPVMTAEFTFSFIGRQARDEAIAAWKTDPRDLSLVPQLLDQGLETRDSALWVAPPAHLQTLEYRGPRLGVRRDEGGRWEWVFLIRSVRE